MSKTKSIESETPAAVAGAAICSAANCEQQKHNVARTLVAAEKILNRSVAIRCRCEKCNYGWWEIYELVRVNE